MRERLYIAVRERLYIAVKYRLIGRDRLVRLVVAIRATVIIGSVYQPEELLENVAATTGNSLQLIIGYGTVCVQLLIKSLCFFFGNFYAIFLG